MTLLITLSALAIVMTVAAEVMQPAHAVFSGDMSPKARSGDADYADRMDAWDAKNWDGVVAAMRKVVARRPWHDKTWEARIHPAFPPLRQSDPPQKASPRKIANLRQRPFSRDGFLAFG